MRLHHATPARNLSSILRNGLLKSRSKGRLKAVWLCCKAKTAWALLHVVQRHRSDVRSVVVVEVEVNRSALRRSRRGLWYSVDDVSPENIRHITTFGEVSASPITQESVS